MAATPGWDELSRSEQRLLIKLFGGGSTRNENSAVVDGLRRRGLVDEDNELATPGLLVFTLAMRHQQENAKLRVSLSAQPN